MAEYTEKIPQHRHCRNCGKAFVGDGNFCSDACKGSAGSVAKKKVRKLMMVWIAIVVITVAAVLIYYFGTGA